MYRSIRALAASVWILVSVGCGGDDTPDVDTTVGNALPTPQFTPPPVIEDDQDGNGAEPTALYNRWGACSSSSQCLPNEQCIRGITESFNVCLSSCVSVDDCIDPSIPVHANFTAFMTCTEFQGAKRCILGCQTTAQCIAGMQCITGACVWKQ
ncbi:MAG: hypothetical protein RLZZ450_7598 [Pseudomonadota bacterium]|jgi:hypothetical protein